jgi:hypothetical protein
MAQKIPHESSPTNKMPTVLDSSESASGNSSFRGVTTGESPLSVQETQETTLLQQRLQNLQSQVNSLTRIRDEISDRRYEMMNEIISINRRMESLQYEIRLINGRM